MIRCSTIFFGRLLFIEILDDEEDFSAGLMSVAVTSILSSLLTFSTFLRCRFFSLATKVGGHCSGQNCNEHATLSTATNRSHLLRNLCVVYCGTHKINLERALRLSRWLFIVAKMGRGWLTGFRVLSNPLVLCLRNCITSSLHFALLL